MQVLYTARASVTGGRAGGRARTHDGRLDVAVEPPPELGGPGGDATNPEQLLAAGWGACFLSAMNAVAGARGLDADGFAVDAHVELRQDERRRFVLAAELRATTPGLDDEAAEKLLRLAHRGCPFSRAMRGNVDVRLFAGERELEERAA